MNDLKIFKNEKFNDLECNFYKNLTTNEIYMTRTQIGQALEYMDPNKSIQKIHSRNKERLDKFSTTVILGGALTTLYTPKGIYEICRYSNQPKANAFYDWVYEVLEKIQKTGGYIAGEENMTEDELVLKAINVLNAKVENLKNENTKLLIDNENQNQLLENQKPKVLFAESVETSKSSILIGELAKIIKQNGYDIGQNRLFEWLRQNGYLISRKGTDYNMPTQKAMNLGLFEIKETSITHSDGHISVSKTVKVNGTGQVYFVNKFLA